MSAALSEFSVVVETLGMGAFFSGLAALFLKRLEAGELPAKGEGSSLNNSFFCYILASIYSTLYALICMLRGLYIMSKSEVVPSSTISRKSLEKTVNRCAEVLLSLGKITKTLSEQWLYAGILNNINNRVREVCAVLKDKSSFYIEPSRMNFLSFNRRESFRQSKSKSKSENENENENENEIETNIRIRLFPIPKHTPKENVSTIFSFISPAVCIAFNEKGWLLRGSDLTKLSEDAYLLRFSHKDYRYAEKKAETTDSISPKQQYLKRLLIIPPVVTHGAKAYIQAMPLEIKYYAWARPDGRAFEEYMPYFKSLGLYTRYFDYISKCKKENTNSSSLPANKDSESQRNPKFNGVSKKRGSSAEKTTRDVQRLLARCEFGSAPVHLLQIFKEEERALPLKEISSYLSIKSGTLSSVIRSSPFLQEVLRYKKMKFLIFSYMSKVPCLSLPESTLSTIFSGNRGMALIGAEFKDMPMHPAISGDVDVFISSLSSELALYNLYSTFELMKEMVSSGERPASIELRSIAGHSLEYGDIVSKYEGKGAEEASEREAGKGSAYKKRVREPDRFGFKGFPSYNAEKPCPLLKPERGAKTGEVKQKPAMAIYTPAELLSWLVSLDNNEFREVISSTGYRIGLWLRDSFLPKFDDAFVSGRLNESEASVLLLAFLIEQECEKLNVSKKAFFEKVHNSRLRDIFWKEAVLPLVDKMESRNPKEVEEAASALKDLPSEDIALLFSKKIPNLGLPARKFALKIIEDMPVPEVKNAVERLVSAGGLTEEELKIARKILA
ncbi:MAG: hypothetical protein QW728_02580 [Thermoplasmata archaeon]